MSDTPRTDAEIIYPGGGICMVRPEFSRTLERELAESEAMRQAEWIKAGIASLQKQLGDAEQENAKLRDALNAALNYVPQYPAKIIREALAKATGDLVGMWDAMTPAERAEATKAMAQGMNDQIKS